VAFSAATTIEAACASDEASTASVVQSVLVVACNAESILWVSALARSPRIACAWVELNMILPSDCAKVFRAKNFSADHIDAVIRVYDDAGN
jgi:hypothetical protein